MIVADTNLLVHLFVQGTHAMKAEAVLRGSVKRCQEQFPPSPAPSRYVICPSPEPAYHRSPLRLPDLPAVGCPCQGRREYNVSVA